MEHEPERNNAETPARPWRPFGHRRRAAWVTAVVVAATTLLFVARAWAPGAAWLDSIDRAWHDRMVASQAEGPLAFARFLEWFGGAWFTAPLRLLVVGLLAWRHRWSRFRFWLLAAVSAQVVSLLFKVTYDRSRPVDQLSETFTASFPSGHTTNAAMIAFGLAVLGTSPGPLRTFALVLATLWTATMGWSRTYLRDHWATDVVAGAGVGLGCVLLAGLIVSPRARASERPRALRGSPPSGPAR